MLGAGAALIILATAFAPAPILAVVPRPAIGVDIQLARTIAPWLGTRYRWGHNEWHKGTDCSGFTQAVMRDALDIQLPRNSRDQYKYGRAVKRADLRLGDLVFFDLDNATVVTHVGIYMGNGRFAHASKRYGVTYDELGSPYYRHAYRGARRVSALVNAPSPDA